MAKFITLFVGISEIVAGVILVAFANPVGIPLIIAGVGTTIGGIGTLISANQSQGLAVPTRNPTADRTGAYGEVKTGGTVIYMHYFGDSDKYLDLVFALADHPCEAIDRLYFDNALIQIDPTSKTSFTPVQQTVNIANISRTNNVVTVVLNANIPFAAVGVDVYVKGVTGDESMNGKVMIDTIVSQIPGSPGSLTFTYLSGGTTDTFSGQGQVETAWPDYGRKVYFEYQLGNQTTTFDGMLNGTPDDGALFPLAAPIQDGSNPWNASRIGNNCTVAFIRLHYNQNYFAGGIPTISFGMRGKNDILDPRTNTTGYTNNWALCVADYLSNTRFGMKCVYGTEIPLAPLIAQANISDEAVALANGGTEPRYTVDGLFPYSMERGMVLQNLMTAAAGRISCIGGQWFLYAAAWYGSTPVSISDLSQMAGPMKWSSAPTAPELFNRVRGKYSCPSNRWEPGDFPAYARDTDHGYTAPAGHTGYYDYYLTADNNDRRDMMIELPFTISCAKAQRLAKIMLERSRQFGHGTLSMNMWGYQFVPTDVISATIGFFLWTSKLLEVAAVRLKTEAQNTDGVTVTLLGVEIDVQETASTVYDWSTTEEQTDQGYSQAQSPTLSSFQTTWPGVRTQIKGVPPTGANLSNAYYQIPFDVTLTGGQANDNLPPSSGDLIADHLYSTDKMTWTSVYSGQVVNSTTEVASGQTKLHIASGALFGVQTSLAIAQLQAGWYVRLDIEAAGGASNVEITLNGYPSQSASTVQAPGSGGVFGQGGEPPGIL